MKKHVWIITSFVVATMLVIVACSRIIPSTAAQATATPDSAVVIDTATPTLEATSFADSPEATAMVGTLTSLHATLTAVSDPETTEATVEPDTTTEPTIEPDETITPDAEPTEDSSSNGTAVAQAPTQPAQTSDSGTTITMSRATWDTGWFQAELFKQLLNQMGYTVQLVDPMDAADFYGAAARREVDMWPNGWFPLHNTYMRDAEVQGRVTLVGSEVRGGALQGYLIDKKTADDLGIVNLEDFKRPEVAAEFDRDGNGKADLIGCPSGWGCHAVIEHHMEAYELGDTVEHIQGEYDDLMAETITRFEDGGAVLFYTWTPNWTLGKLIPGKDVVWIEVPFASLPEEQKDKEELTTVENVSGCVANPCNMGFPPNDIRVAANTDFLKNNTQVKRLLELVEIPLNDIAIQNSSMFDGENTAEDVQRHVEEWIAQNQEQVDAWVQQAQTFTGGSILQRVRDRGNVLCGIDGKLQGFSYRDTNGSYSGFNADFCRVIATAIFGDPETVEFVPLDMQKRFAALSDQKIDVLFHNTTWVAVRDVGMDPPNSGIRLDFGPTIFHDGQRFMVPKGLTARKSGEEVTQIAQLSDMSICVLKDTPTEQNLIDQFEALSIEVKVAPFEDVETVYDMYERGVCDAVTEDTSELVAHRLNLQDPDNHIILGEQISRAPKGPVFIEDDSEWADVVSWAIYATIYAEELDVDSTNVQSLQETNNPDIQLLLGQKGSIGEKLGLTNDFARNIIEGVGNYAEIYNRNLGPDTALNLERGPNKAWNKGQGGVLSSPPFR